MNTGLSCVECAVSEIPVLLRSFVNGFPLNVPTVTLSGTVVPSATDSAATGRLDTPQTHQRDFRLTFPFQVTAGRLQRPLMQVGQTSSTAGGKSGAVQVMNKTEAICLLFSVCLTSASVLVT